MQQKKISMGPILFLYYEESLVSSNLNSKLFWFHSAHPNVNGGCYPAFDKNQHFRASNYSSNARLVQKKYCFREIVRYLLYVLGKFQCAFF